jgi:carbon starvation protein CstA
MRLPRIHFKVTCKYLGKKCKEFGILVWGNIKRIRHLPSWARAPIVFVLYTVATKPIEKLAEILGTMNTLAASNMTALAEYLDTSSKDLWVIILQVLIIILFVAFASWLWGNSNKKDTKDTQELKEKIEKLEKTNEQILDELRKGRRQ